MSYKHLTLNERNKIEVLNKEGYSSRRIAKILGLHLPEGIKKSLVEALMNDRI